MLADVQARELWIADRNMSTLGFLLGVHQRQADLIIREHKTLPRQAVSQLQACGQVETGDLFEQTITIADGQRSL